MIDIIFAKTHSAEYLLHKYWARKPHNVLNILTKKILKKKGVVLDPFCGSGVFLREASKLGHSGYGYDINPVASILSDITCNPPDYFEFKRVIEPILEDFQKECLKFYKTKNNSNIKYFIHEVITTCPNCKTHQTKQESKKQKNINICKNCKKRLSFSLKNLSDTKISGIFTDKKIINNKEELINAKNLENLNKKKIFKEFNLDFTENNRILAFKGMQTKDLFTVRNFYLLGFLANKIHKIKDEKIKNTSLLLLTASAAQCSRLIAHRNKFTTGGPAWSVPGFWVPPIHIEGNPYTHISARLKKFYNGIKLLSQKKNSKIKIFNEDCINLKNTFKGKIDLVFLDPPYGDSVPYMEFSMMWNSFYKRNINLSKDISVSDKNNQKNISWLNYKELLIDRIKVLQKLLTIKGKLLVTFNNHDQRAWEALVESLQRNSMYCSNVMYQLPAVISSKAQFSKDGSYISDIYSIFIKKKNFKYPESTDKLKKDVLKSAKLRNGVISKQCLFRTIYMSILKNNLSFKVIKNVDDFIKKNFFWKKNNYFLKNYKKTKVSNLSKIVNKIFIKHRSFEKKNWEDLYLDILKKVNDISLVEPSEINKIVDITSNFKKDLNLLKYEAKQSSFKF